MLVKGSIIRWLGVHGVKNKRNETRGISDIMKQKKIVSTSQSDLVGTPLLVRRTTMPFTLP